MPLFTLCKHPGCRHPVPRGEDFCEKHKEDAARRQQTEHRQRDRRREALKGSASARGYGARWQRLRARFLREHPLCVDCARLGRVTPATDVDHIQPHRGDQDLMWDESNLQPLCHRCHSKKTAREDGGFGNSRGRGGSKVPPKAF
ncbi:HNH endonuclease [Sutterella wadsworthensis]|uniref:HNH endonuclease n=1 Tax=Sutterella wadsworthensis TaxID=40545 RepID=UPI0005864BBB|nr:HNH endonuclease signature motif containing protein [Sutterella wadsworthensis]